MQAISKCHVAFVLLTLGISTDLSNDPLLMLPVFDGELC